MTEASKNLFDLAGDYPLTQNQIEFFRRDGHVTLRGVASAAEVQAFRPHISATVEKMKKEFWGGVYNAPLEERETYYKAFVQITNLWQHDGMVKKFVLAHRFAKIAATLLGADSVRLYHDQALFKEPGGGHTPWHQDQYYWPLDTEKTITMWMPLVDAPIETGPVVFATGSHRHGALGTLAISDESEEYFRRIVAEKGFSLAINELYAGDVTFHFGWTLHKAPGNTTNRMREAITIIYYADGARISEPQNQNQQADLEAWFPGQKPGEAAASLLNPLL
jgi:ectoine hydroxylase-related dioxygenase (phytanoyl-CoA dioxygenase family)